MAEESTKPLPAMAIGGFSAFLDRPCGSALSLRLTGGAVAFRAARQETMRNSVSRRTSWLRWAVLFAACGAVAACNLGGEARYPTERPRGASKPVYGEPESIFGPGGLTLGGTEKPGEGEAGGGGIGVNSFLWRASLDTVSFMPLVSADPFGGVIITDWYSPPQSPDERFKVNVYILGRALRADGIRTSVFRQQLNGTSGWIDAPVAANTATDLENAILTRARQMRIAQLGE
jgi:hypothetical protein